MEGIISLNGGPVPPELIAARARHASAREEHLKRKVEPARAYLTAEAFDVATLEKPDLPPRRPKAAPKLARRKRRRTRAEMQQAVDGMPARILQLSDWGPAARRKYVSQRLDARVRKVDKFVDSPWAENWDADVQRTRDIRQGLFDARCRKG